MRILWSPLAVDRVSEIAEYIARDNPAAAEAWTTTVFEKVGGLITFPESGRVVPETNDKRIRELLYGNYRIVYRVEPKRISVLYRSPWETNLAG